MSQQIVLSINDQAANLEKVGGKGASLARLYNAGFPVPGGFHVSTEAYRRFVAKNELQPLIEAALEKVDPEKPSTLEDAARSIQNDFLNASIPADIAGEIADAYGDLRGTNPAVAVRSSATAEDLPEASFAGQQESYLNVCGADHVLEAVKKCWSSLWTARAIGYRLRQEIDQQGIALAVVVQLLVNAEVAGILFTANPISGVRDHSLINAAWGLGDAVVGGRVTPDEYVVDKARGCIISKKIAEKEVMTVRIDGTTEDRQVSKNLRKAPALQDEDLIALSNMGAEIENLYGGPMDIEWTLADGSLSIVQARPITALPEPGTAPTDWPIPDPKGRYLRASIVDMMPDPLSPLFSTMGIPSYNKAIIQMMVDLANAKEDRLPPEIIITINDYAYMTAGFSAIEWWEMLSKLAPKMPRLIREGPAHFREQALPDYQAAVAELEKTAIGDLSARELWDDAHDLIRAAVYHLSILQVDTLGAAAGSEGLFTSLYNKLYRREGDPPAPVFLMGYDTTPIQLEKSVFDLAQSAKGHEDLLAYLLNTPSSKLTVDLQSETPPVDVTTEAWNTWRTEFKAHLKLFGHILYDIDFAKTIPAENPIPMLETMKMYLRDEGANPHERQGRLAQEREQAIADLMGRARGLRGWAIKKSLGWAQSLARVREDSVASLGLSYPRLRQVLLELGGRMSAAGALEYAEDIFWLYKSEVESTLEALDRQDPLESLDLQVNARKARIEAERQLMPPSQIPDSKTYMGLPVEAFVPHEGEQQEGKLIGVGASAGSITGEACVLHGPEDFDAMKKGGILVAKMTTPAWTPLFAMAAGIVTDIGGPLSHGSIVAREYGIPAVLGTGMATRMIQHGQQITIDGDAGLVILVEG